jgi:phosphoglycerate kinase
LLRDSMPAPGLLVDIGQQTVSRYSGLIAAAGTVFVNGPAGIYEEPDSELGTRALWAAMASAPAFTVIGGGDSIAAARHFGLLDGFSYVCTAGGGLVRFLAGEPLAVVEALRAAAARGSATSSPDSPYSRTGGRA